MCVSVCVRGVCGVRLVTSCVCVVCVYLCEVCGVRLVTSCGCVVCVCV